MSALPDLPLPPALAVEAEPFPVEHLDAVLAIEPDAQDEGEGEPAALRWQPRTPDEAEWAMRHLAAAEAEVDAMSDQRDSWEARITQWFDQATAPLRRRVDFFRGHLIGYALRERERTGGTVKTVNLPSGYVGTRSQPPRLAVTDEDALIEWADAMKVGDEVAPAGPRRVRLAALRHEVELVEVIDLARVLLHTGEWVTWDAGSPERKGFRCPGIGDAWGDDGLVAQVDVTSTYWVVLDRDGAEVPGVRVERPTVSANVVSTP